MKSLKWVITLLTLLVAVMTTPVSVAAAETPLPDTEAVTMPPAYTSLPDVIPPELEALERMLVVSVSYRFRRCEKSVYNCHIISPPSRILR